MYYMWLFGARKEDKGSLNDIPA